MIPDAVGMPGLTVEPGSSQFRSERTPRVNADCA